jgi:uncharacterized membrane protein (DUF485 family)
MIRITTLIELTLLTCVVLYANFLFGTTVAAAVTAGIIIGLTVEAIGTVLVLL